MDFGKWYIVVQAKDIEELAFKVEIEMRKGYIPTGGIVATENAFEQNLFQKYIYSQALYKTM